MKKITFLIMLMAAGLLAGCDSDNNSSNSVNIDQTTSDSSFIRNGNLVPALFATQTDLDLDYAQKGVDLISGLNGAFILPADIDVIFTDCGVANAFYVPAVEDTVDGDDELPDDTNVNLFPGSAGGSIIMCHELTQLFANFYPDVDQAVSASIFVLMHELGHALVNQLSLPVLGIEESYVDGMAAVFVGEAGLSEGSVLAGWFFGNQTDTPFFDSHRAGPQRLGDLACWGVGSDPLLAADPIIDSIATQLTTGGRNCPAEYAQQLSGLTTVLEPHIRGNLQDVFSEALF